MARTAPGRGHQAGLPPRDSSDLLSISSPADFNHREQRFPCTLGTQGLSGVALPKFWLGAEVVVSQCCVRLPKATCQQGDAGAHTGLVPPSPPATPSCLPPGSLQGALTVPGDACALVPLIAAWSLGSSPSPLLLVPGTPLVGVNNLPFPAEHQDRIKAHGEPFAKTRLSLVGCGMW